MQLILVYLYNKFSAMEWIDTFHQCNDAVQWSAMIHSTSAMMQCNGVD